jgi:hypothetical protein
MVEEKKENDARSDLTKNQRSLLERVEALALVYSPNAKEIPQKAWTFWFDAVKGSTLNEISDAISDWSKTQSRMMTPSDLYKMLSNQRLKQRELEAKEQAQKDHQPLPKNVAQVFTDKMNESLKKNIPADAWARRNRIREAYGFVMPEFVARLWRRALNLPDDYHFEDTKGVFPLENYPDERTSFYHDCRIHFMHEYEERHGLTLEFDKDLAKKRYQTAPAREAA